MNSNDALELVADAMRNSGRTCDEDSWPEVMALEAVNALQKAGYVLVPREPTDAMIKAGGVALAKEYGRVYCQNQREDADICWKKMIEAAEM